MNNERRDGLDSILDAALRDYSNPAPRAGFERRIVGRIQLAPPMRRSRVWIGWVLAPVSVAVIVLAVITAGHHRPQPRQQLQPLPQIASIVQPPVQPLPPAPARKARR